MNFHSRPPAPLARPRGRATACRQTGRRQWQRGGVSQSHLSLLTAVSAAGVGGGALNIQHSRAEGLPAWPSPSLRLRHPLRREDRSMLWNMGACTKGTLDRRNIDPLHVAARALHSGRCIDCHSKGWAKRSLRRQQIRDMREWHPVPLRHHLGCQHALGTYGTQRAGLAWQSIDRSLHPCDAVECRLQGSAIFRRSTNCFFNK